MKKGNIRGKTMSLPDERKLGYLIIGEGHPVFWFHGLPGSRISVLNLSKISGPLKLIGVDRPGFGWSSFTAQRRMSDFAQDVNFLADQLKIDKFAVVGWSGGSHYAITCAAVLPERITKVVVISGLSLPLNTSEMNSMNKMMYDQGTRSFIGSIIQRQVRGRFFQFLSEPRKFARTSAGKYFIQQYAEADHNFWLRKDNFWSRIREVYAQSLVEAYNQGDDSIKAMIQEIKLMKKGWDVDLSQIPKGSVYIWHGEDDRNIPVYNAHKNAKEIPGAHLEIFEEAGHMFLFENLKKLSELLKS
jgi:pimeloyl-ACP methyl ester carboxylesterase